MNLIILTYDLNKQGKDYTGLRKTIKEKFNDFRKPTESTYILNTQLEPHQVSEIVREHFDSDDCFFIGKLYRLGAGTASPDDFWKWFDFS